MIYANKLIELFYKILKKKNKYLYKLLIFIYIVLTESIYRLVGVELGEAELRHSGWLKESVIVNLETIWLTKSNYNV